MAKLSAVTAMEAMIENNSAPMWSVLTAPLLGVTRKDLYWAMVSTSSGPPRRSGGRFGWKLSTTM